MTDALTSRLKAIWGPLRHDEAARTVVEAELETLLVARDPITPHPGLSEQQWQKFYATRDVPFLESRHAALQGTTDPEDQRELAGLEAVLATVGTAGSAEEAMRKNAMWPTDMLQFMLEAVGGPSAVERLGIARLLEQRASVEDPRSFAFHPQAVGVVADPRLTALHYQHKVKGADGVARAPIAYESTAAYPLFVGVPSSKDFAQHGSIADCHLMASLSALADTRPDLLKSLVTEDGPLLRFTLHDDDGPRSVVLDRDLPASTTHQGPLHERLFTAEPRVADGTPADQVPLWAPLFEKAWVSMQPQGYESVGGGVTGAIFTMFFGDRVTTTELPRDSFGLVAAIKAAVAAGQPMTACTSYEPAFGLRKKHAHSLVGVHEVNGKTWVVVRDPHRDSRLEPPAIVRRGDCLIPLHAFANSFMEAAVHTIR